MTSISVKASTSYDILVGTGIISRLAETVCAVTPGSKVCVVSDSNVFPAYGQQAIAILTAQKLEVCTYIFPAGESSKCFQTYLSLLNFLAENQLTRSDCIVALGGGVTGDLAGFAAATYLRGIPYIQVPTTLLAMVDSSVGGKTAIDLPAGKNLCGAFCQPAAVLCDLELLGTLPEDVFLDGCAEVIKYAVLFDPELFDHLHQHGTGFDKEYVICRCIRHKAQVVEMDERDQGRRMLLNLGHTLGHAIEQCSNYSVSHGKAVSIGIAMMVRSAKCCDEQRIVSLLQQFHLPDATTFSPMELYNAALADKKRDAQGIHMVVPQSIGHCQIQSVSLDALKTLIEEGM